MTIIQCPSCNTKYRLKLEIAEGQHVRCPGCRHVWRFLPPQPEQDAILLSESLAQAFADETDTPSTPQLPEPESEPSYSNIMSSPVLPRQAEPAAEPETAAPAARPVPPRSFRNEAADDDSPFWTGARPIKAPEIPEWARKASSGFPAPRAGAAEAEPAAETRSAWEDAGTDYDDADVGAVKYAGDAAASHTGTYADEEAEYEDEVAQYRPGNRAGLHEAVTGADYGGGTRHEGDYDGADDATGLTGDQDEAAAGPVAKVASQSWVSELAEVMARREEPIDFDYRMDAPYSAPAASTARGEYDYDDSASLDPETAGAGDGGSSEISDMARLEDADRLDAFWRETADQEEPPAFTNKAPPLVAGPLDDDDSDVPIDPIYADYAQPAADRRFGSLTAMAAWGLYLTFVAGLIGGAVGFRDHLVQLLPGAATYYAQFGLPVGGAALTFQNVTYAWSERDGKPLIEVKGEVLNATGSSVTVPMLNIVVKDDQAIEVASTAANITEQPLEGGSTAPFTLEFLAPPSRVSEIELTFRARQPG